MTTRPRAFARHDPRQAGGRLLISAGFGIATALLVPSHFGAALRAIAAWDTAALMMGTLTWMLILRAGPEETRRYAADHDPGRHTVGALVILTSCISLVANAVVLRQARAVPSADRGLFIVACVVAVTSAWLVTHSAYSLRYAHLYYGHDSVGGLVFPGDAAPAYIDFAYFAFTIGMCFQVSDVSISSRPLRRAALDHSLLSFLYNTAILATAVNLVTGVFG